MIVDVFEERTRVEGASNISCLQLIKTGKCWEKQPSEIPALVDLIKEGNNCGKENNHHLASDLPHKKAPLVERCTDNNVKYSKACL